MLEIWSRISAIFCFLVPCACWCLAWLGRSSFVLAPKLIKWIWDLLISHFSYLFGWLTSIWFHFEFQDTSEGEFFPKIEAKMFPVGQTGPGPVGSPALNQVRKWVISPRVYWKWRQKFFNFIFMKRSSADFRHVDICRRKLLVEEENFLTSPFSELQFDWIRHKSRYRHWRALQWQQRWNRKSHQWYY